MLHDVKVLSPDGSGKTNDILDGLDYSVGQTVNMCVCVFMNVYVSVYIYICVCV